jgi:hypothetical protein
MTLFVFYGPSALFPFLNQQQEDSKAGKMGAIVSFAGDGEKDNK